MHSQTFKLCIYGITLPIQLFPVIVTLSILRDIHVNIYSYIFLIL